MTLLACSAVSPARLGWLAPAGGVFGAVGAHRAFQAAATVGRVVVGTAGALLVHRRAHHADAAAAAQVEAVGAHDEDFGIGLLGQVVVAQVDRGGEGRSLEIARVAVADVHQAADAAFDVFGRRVLVHVHAGDHARNRAFDIELASAGSVERAAVDLRRGLVAQATDGQAGTGAHRRGALAAVAVALHAGDAGQRFSHVQVGQLADVFGGDGIHHFHRVALDGHRGTGAGADAGHHDGAILGQRARRHEQSLCHRQRQCGNRQRVLQCIRPLLFHFCLQLF
jgi:hypothetical protein